MKTYPLPMRQDLDILDLTNPDDVARSSDTAKAVFWIAPKNPASLAGSLLHDPATFRGAWFEPGRIMVQTGPVPRAFHLEIADADRTAIARALLLRVLATDGPPARQPAILEA